MSNNLVRIAKGVPIT